MTRAARLSCRTLARLFDHPFGTHQKRLRDRETKRFGGLEVDDELELRRLLDRQVSRLNSFKNAVHEICRTSIQTENVHAVANESSGLSVFPGSYRGQSVRKRSEWSKWRPWRRARSRCRPSG